MIKKFFYRVSKCLARFTNRRSVTGRGNRIHIPINIWMKDSAIYIEGNNNVINVSPMARICGVRFYIKGDDNVVIIGQNVSIEKGSVLWIEDNKCAITINKGSTFGSVHLAVTEDNSSITIGKDCMFSDDIDVRTGDSHSVINLQSGRRENPAQDVIIGDHVWCGAHTSILKGAIIPSNTIIATRSVVAKGEYSQNTIIGGMPSKTIKEHITWKRERIKMQ